MPFSSNIVISRHLDELNDLLKGRNVFAIVDSRLAGGDFYDGFLREYVPELPAGRIALHASEAEKTVSTAEGIAKALLEAGADRDAMILGIGGGITTDIAGFIAATYMRGVTCGLVPTTLLAQVDAAIGGKNGVNLDRYKNMIGTIRQPEFVFISPAFLPTLPEREFKCGISEMLKTFLIADKNSYEAAVKHFSGEKECDELQLIQKAVEIKCGIVERDERENGERRLLNLGHTFGHAIEKVQQEGPEALMHGEAVAAGTITAAKMSCKLGLLQKEELEKLESDYARLSLPTRLPVTVDEALEAVGKDKKRSGETINFVILEHIGKAVIKPLTIQEIKKLATE